MPIFSFGCPKRWHITRSLAVSRLDQDYPSNPKSRIDIDIWFMAQAASFCFTNAILCQSFSGDGPYRYPWAPTKALFETSSWINIGETNPQLRPEEDSKSVVIHHTLANRVVGLLGARFGAYLAQLPEDVND
ncbi:hypothetical protein HYALB_00009852 [Hymenoscyphus albidus]|uniref:Uncharacterized protein n=1 Tax=Hymenoscyphus albidus TaxID=595503 RepID=A0A9N9M3Z7_9HELO|nr:hypothetical protein HYALB_00009852 [Hymenoscyphus albidus]